MSKKAPDSQSSDSNSVTKSSDGHSVPISSDFHFKVWHWFFHRRSHYDEFRDFTQWTPEKHFFWISNLLLPIILIYGFYFLQTTGDIGAITCPLRLARGMYCPFCGGTRSLLALMHGQILSSIRYNPFLLTALVSWLPWYISNLLHYISVRNKAKNCIPGLRCHIFYVVIPLLAVLINFLIKNYFLLVRGIALIP